MAGEYDNMLRKYILTLLALFILAVLGPNGATADDGSPACARLDEKASGDMLKYSLDATVYNPLFFGDISCGIRYRKNLCAMEMVSFDTSAMVYDYFTAEKIAIGKAYFWLDETGKDAPVLAFSSKESAEKYGAEKYGGIILDYTALTGRLLK